MPSCFLLTSKSSLRSLAGLLVLFFLSASSAFAAAGKIQFVAGVAKIINDKKIERPAVKGDALEQGDSIVTGANGAVQVALADGGLLAVRPNTQMRIDAYAYSGKADDSNNKSFFSLAKGAFRSITGAIGHNNKQAYKVTTPTATMGIRGTDHEPAYFPPLPPGFPLPPGAPLPGTYDFVNSGQTFIQTPYGLIVIKPNQVGFAPAGGGAPVILPNVPAFYSSAPKPTLVTNSSDTSTSTSSGSGSSTSGTTTLGTSTLLGTSTTSTSGTSVSTNTALTTTSIATTITTTTTTTPIFQPPGYAPLGSGVVGAYVNSGGGGNNAGTLYLTAPPPTQDISLGPQYEVFHLFDGTASPTFEFFSNASALNSQGSYTFVDGARVDWGRWSAIGMPSYAVFDNGVQQTTIGDFHYAVSTDITPISYLQSGALTGVIAYNYVGGTTPTDLAGSNAIFNSAALSVDFTAQTVNLNVNVTAGSTPLNGTASGTLSAFVTPNVGISGGSAVILKAFGQFVGPTASGAITSYDIRDMGGNGAIGTAVFAR